MEFKADFEKLSQIPGFVIRGSTIIAEMMPEPEYKTAGGLIVSTPSDHLRGTMRDNKLEAATVLAVGPGYWNEELKEYEPLEVQPGAVVVLPQYAVQMISTFPGMTKPSGNKLVIVKMDSILLYYKDQESYRLAQESLK